MNPVERDILLNRMRDRDEAKDFRWWRRAILVVLAFALSWVVLDLIDVAVLRWLVHPESGP